MNKSIPLGLIASSGAQIETGVKIVPPVRLYGAVILAKNCSIGKFTFIGNRTKVSPRTVVGNYCSIARDIELGAANHPLTMMSTHSFQYNAKHFPIDEYQQHKRIKVTISPQKKQPVKVGNDVWIGAKSVIMRGVTIGNGAVVGSGAVVTKDVPPYAIVVGVPAKILRYRFDEEIISMLQKSRWWELNPIDMDGIVFDDPIAATKGIAEVRKKLRKQNRELLEKELSNSYSGSSEGIIWIESKFGHAHPKYLKDFSAINILSVSPDKQSSPKKQKLTIGKYSIENARFDASKSCYRVSIASLQGEVYAGKLEPNSIQFRLVE